MGTDLFQTCVLVTQSNVLPFMLMYVQYLYISINNLTMFRISSIYTGWLLQPALWRSNTSSRCLFYCPNWTVVDRINDVIEHTHCIWVCTGSLRLSYTDIIYNTGFKQRNQAFWWATHHITLLLIYFTVRFKSRTVSNVGTGTTGGSDWRKEDEYVTSSLDNSVKVLNMFCNIVAFSSPTPEFLVHPRLRPLCTLKDISFSIFFIWEKIYFS